MAVSVLWLTSEYDPPHEGATHLEIAIYNSIIYIIHPKAQALGPGPGTGPMGQRRRPTGQAQGIYIFLYRFLGVGGWGVIANQLS